MEAVILAGGYGTRLKEVVSDVPKPMAPVAGKPFLEILLRSLSRKGFTRIILSIGYMAEKIVSYFGDSFAGIEIVYEIEMSPLGTGGAINRSLAHCKNDYAFIFNGDTYLDLEVDSILAHWLIFKNPIIVARHVDDVTRYGCLQTSAGQVTQMLEKGTTGPGLINAGCYVFPRNIFAEFDVSKPFSLETDYLAQALKKQRFDLYVTSGDFIDIGIPSDYEKAQTYLKDVI